MTEIFRALTRTLFLALIIVIAMSVSRIVLLTMFWGRVEPTGGLTFILLQGVRFDIILIGMLIGPALLFKPFFHALPRAREVGRWLWPLYFALVASLVFYVESSTWSFINEYDTRPNYLFVEYLKYPRELVLTLLGSYLWEFIIFNTLTVVIFFGVFRWMRRDPAAGQVTSMSRCLMMFPLMAVVVLMMIRSTLDHRPVNPSIAAFSPDSMVNQLAMNSPYSVLYAIYEQYRDNRPGEVHYGVMEHQEVVTRMIVEAGIAPLEKGSLTDPTLHRQVATRTHDRPQNIVIILQESLGAEFVGSLGGKNLTPHIDRAAADGIWLEQLYATGTRSVRGIEAVISGFTPTHRRSVVKLMETQDDFFTIASLLEKQSYQTSFIYGGEAHFDNMKRFFLNNGFQTVIDENDYENPIFYGAWGMSDEDLFNRAHEQFSNAGDKPFFSLVFTSSNHKPFDIPAGRVATETGPDGARETAVKYADYAFGQYLEKAKTSNYWDNTVFLIVADHNSRVLGDQLIPIERFHIPGLFFGGKIESRRIPGISSQIDLLPTLLSLAGVSAEHPAIGRDLTTPEYRQGAGRAIMQFYDIAAYLVPGRAVIMRHDLGISSHLYQPGRGLRPDPRPDLELERMALAYALFGSVMVERGSYRGEH